jgi:hypothetical protein
MTTRTKVQLATSVLRKFGALDALESGSSADVAYITAEYEELLAYLEDKSRAYWPEDAIPLAVFQIMVRLVANEVEGAFGKESSVESREARRELIMKELIKHVARPASGLPAKARYY